MKDIRQYLDLKADEMRPLTRLSSFLSSLCCTVESRRSRLEGSLCSDMCVIGRCSSCSVAVGSRLDSEGEDPLGSAGGPTELGYDLRSV